MSLQESARVQATPNFLENMDAAHRYFVLQDADSAASRLTKLKSELRAMVSILSWSPASGRPARFLAAKSAQARLKADAVQRLAEQTGLPSLREFIVSQHIVLYAHSGTEVVLLAIKPPRQLAYSAEI